MTDVRAGSGCTPDERWTVVWISAKAKPSLREVERALADWQRAGRREPRGLQPRWSPGIRVAAVGRSMDEAFTALEQRLERVAQHAPALPPVFMFTGQGSQAIGMAKGLLANRHFAGAFTWWCDALTEPSEPPLLEIISGEQTSDAQLANTWNAQRALLALEVALANLWTDAGVTPGAVVGHSVGELAAVHVAGGMSAQTAVELVRTRASLMAALPQGGAMLAVRANEDEVVTLLPGGACVAAVNTPSNTVISGRADEVARAQESLEGAGIACQRLNVSHAFHSFAMDAMLEEFSAATAKLPFTSLRIPLSSSLDGELVSHALGSSYWSAQARQPVRFVHAVQSLHRAGYRTFLEVGPSDTLKRFGKRITPTDCRWLSSLEQSKDDVQCLLSAAAELFEAGAMLDWGIVLGR